MPENKPERNNNQPPQRFFNSDSYSNKPINSEEVAQSTSTVDVETTTTAKVTGTVTLEDPIVRTISENREKEETGNILNQTTSDSFSGESSPNSSGSSKTSEDTSSGEKKESVSQDGQNKDGSNVTPKNAPDESKSETPTANPNEVPREDKQSTNQALVDNQKDSNPQTNNEDNKKENSEDNNKPSDNETPSNDTNKKESQQDNKDKKDVNPENNNNQNNPSNANNEAIGENPNQKPGQQGLRRNGNKGNTPQKNFRKNTPVTPNKTGEQNQKETEDNKKGNEEKENAAKKAADNVKKKKEEAKEKKKKAQRIRRIMRFILLHWKIILLCAPLLLFILFLIIFLIVLNSDATGKFSIGGGGGDVSGPVNRAPGTTDSYKCNETVEVPISVKTTPLSREEFIEKVKAYETTSFKNQYNNFKMHAGDIYDLAIGKGYNGKNALGVNPEMVVIRAFNEGFAPGTGYNYWGIGKCNTCSSGGSYSSFMEGVEAYFKTIMSYDAFDKDDIYGVMGKYAYIGEKWYSPGDSSKGGCYYKNYIMKYLQVISSDRANEVEKICKEGSEKATTSEDQLAYAQYQVQTNIMSVRKSIFGLGSDSGNSTCKEIIVTLDPPKPSEIEKLPILTFENAQTVNHLLSNKQSSISKFNEGLSKAVIEGEPGTRKAVANAAIYTINTFYSLGYRLPYSFSGGHDAPYTDQNGVKHDKVSSNYFGINPYIGEKIYTNKTYGYTNTRNGTTTTYYFLGLDCSGFVTWALKNGGIDRPISNAADFLTDSNIGNDNVYSIKDINKYVGQTGDVLASTSHVALILKYEPGQRAYLVAEEAGKNKGLIVNYYNIDSESRQKYKVVDMSYYYKNKKISNYASAFKEGVYK